MFAKRLCIACVVCFVVVSYRSEPVDIQNPIFLKDALAALRRRVRLNYERDIEAIDHVQHLLAEGELAPHTLRMIFGAEPPSSDSRVRFHLKGDSYDRQPLRRMTLIDAIRRIFRTYPTSGWTVDTLEIELRHAGFQFDAKNPKASINTSLAKLLERKIIWVREQGVGRRPSLYQNVDPTPDATERNLGGAQEPPSLDAL